MPPMTLERVTVQCCKSCAHVLKSDSSQTHLRCGLGYYVQPPSTRKQGRMDSYPVVESLERCGRWRERLRGVLDPEDAWFDAGLARRANSAERWQTLGR